jgi:alanine racemase
MTKDTCRSWAEIDRTALRHNAGVVRDRIGSAELLAVVKANGYGHGMIGVAQALANDAQLFGVANLEEAITLRAALPHPIVIFGPATSEERSGIAEGGFIASVSTVEEAKEFDRAARGSPVSINFVIDTGMGRMGALEANAITVFKEILALPNIRIHSVSSHLPVSDKDADYTRDELSRFGKLVRQFREKFPGDYKTHVLPSAGVLAFNDPPFDIVRAGLMLYGISPLPEFEKDLKPVLTWKTRIGLIREMPKGSSISYGRTFITPKTMRVATLTAGYADGYPRHLSNRDAEVIVRGRRCALLGRVTMDLMVVDVTEISAAEVGDEVVLLGLQDGTEISAVELAKRAETITWEITTRIGSRVRRVYI